MNASRIIRAGAVIASVLFASIALPATPAAASDPPLPDGLPFPVGMPWPSAQPLKVGVPWSPTQSNSAPSRSVTIVAPANVPVAPSFTAPIAQNGISRASALEPTNTWQLLGAGASVWYHIGTNGVHMDVWLDANPASGVKMAIFAPNGSDKPIGNGTPYKSDPTRLSWSGGHWQARGNWYALITNGNPFPIQYKIERAQREIGEKSCYSYWEYIGANLVYWTECERGR
jgi:hypothetical protein